MRWLALSYIFLLWSELWSKTKEYFKKFSDKQLDIGFFKKHSHIKQKDRQSYDDGSF